jgi:hypothetical protein
MKRYCKNKLTEKSFSSLTEPEHRVPSENWWIASRLLPDNEVKYGNI